MHISSVKIQFLILLLALPAAIFFFQSNGQAEEVNPHDCLHCHGETISRAMGLKHIHAPLIEQNCAICHVASTKPTTSVLQPDKSDTKEAAPPQVPVDRKIRWLQRHYDPALVHWFLIPAQKFDDTLFVQKSGPDGRTDIVSIPLPPLETLPQLEDDHQPPVISDIHFLGLQRGVLPTAVVSWKTNKPTGSKIMYGIDRVDENTTPYDSLLSTEHLMAISPVTPGKTYQYVIVSTDIFGNRAQSVVQQFSTETFSTMRLPEEKTIPSGPVDLEHHFFALGKKYVLQFIADQPTYLAVGAHRTLQRQPTIKTTTVTGEESAFRHVPLKSSYETSMSACRACHAEYWQGISHPVGVTPSRNVKIPDNYPVLPDGRITCISCHEHHASNNDARMRQATKRDLCIDCHRNYG
ncbi:cytochrome c3 family protein [Desulfolithobacter sp.]